MNNIFYKTLFVFLSFILITSSASALTCTTLTKFLSKGSENSDVLILQQFLADEGYLAVKPNGYFGENTKKALVSFQRKQKIIGSGTAGPLTRATIKEISCSTSRIKISDESVPSKKDEKGPVIVKDSPAVTSIQETPAVIITQDIPTIYVKTFLASDVTSESATLKGSGGIDGEKHWFQWGITMDMKNETPQTANPINYSYTLTGLLPNTAYYFRAVSSVATSTDRKGETAYGDVRSFTTPIATAVIAQTTPAVSITSAGVAVNASGSAKVTWTSSNTNTCTFTGGEDGGSWTSQRSLSGEYITNPMTKSTTFTIECKNNVGYIVTGSVTVPKIVN